MPVMRLQIPFGTPKIISNSVGSEETSQGDIKR